MLIVVKQPAKNVTNYVQETALWNQLRLICSNGDTGGNGETQPSDADADLTNEHPGWYKLIYVVGNIGPFT